MYDVNPLGPMMHLKELERQAAPKLWPVQDTRHGAFVGRKFSKYAMCNIFPLLAGFEKTDATPSSFLRRVSDFSL